MTSNLLQHSFREHDQLLQRFAPYWQLNPFSCVEWPWQQSAAEITSGVKAALQLLPDPLSPSRSVNQTVVLPFWLTDGIAGRKLAQINGFISQLGDQHSPVLEWCAGKGHLGRLLSFQRQCPVHSLEWQADLCQQGQALAQRYQLPQQFQHIDVMTMAADQIPPDHSVVALHACGDLHRQLLQQFSQRHGDSLFLAPCCYHLQAASDYEPMSTPAQQSSLQISRTELKLAVQDFVTAGQRTARLRDTEQLWRLVFEVYRAAQTGNDSYQSLPAVAKQIFSRDISQFMTWACQHQQLPQPSVSLINQLIPLAQQRLLLVRSIDEVRQLFRRPLELWLLLDRALFLQEQGYQVELRQFCRYHDSPRNILIVAQH